jgi:hypothetical protein
MKTDSKEKENSEFDIPQWLKNLQENSWELELLISGGAVFTLIQLPEFFWEWLTNIRIQTSLPGFSIYLVCGILGIKILTNGFILHLIMRAYWLAMVCLNFVYPGGINPKAKGHQFPFKNLHREGDLRDLIMKVDKFCGLVIFSSISSAILLTAILFGIGIFILVLNSIESLDFKFSDRLIPIFSGLILWSWLLYVIDLVGLGFLRKVKYLSILIYPFFQLYDFLTLRSLYARPLSYFGSNVKRGHFYLGAGLFALVTLLTVYAGVFRNMGWKNLLDFREYKFAMAKQPAEFNFRFYADESEWRERQIVFIPSKVIRDNVLPLNVTYVNGMDPLVEASNHVDSLRFVENIMEVSIDDSVYKSTKWFERWERDVSHIGLVAMLPLEQIPNGLHFLKLKSPDLPDSKFRTLVKERGKEFIIPFWKDVH